MKKTLLLIWVLALFVCSCSKEEQTGDGRNSTPVEVTVQINGSPLSKATGNTYANESKVNTLQILAFNASGELEVYKSVDNEMSVQLMASSGQKTIWAIVNAPSLASVKSLNELNGMVSSLPDNALDSFVMTGFLSTELTDGAIVSITVKRLVARVSIAKITTSFPDLPAYAGKTFKLKGIYMLNVAGSVNFSLSGEPSAWFNKLSHADAVADAYLYDSLDETVANNTSYAVEHAFYPYPNNVDISVKAIAAADRGTWSPRRSILCIEAEFDGTLGYYPIELPVIERNKVYIIEEVKITRSPGDKPYDPIETGEATVSMTVADWELGLNLGTIKI